MAIAEKKLKLYELMNQDNYLEKLTNLLSKYCDNPVLTMDYLHQVRSVCGRGSQTSETWNEMIQIGYLDSKRISAFFHKTMQELIENQNQLRIYYENNYIVLMPVMSQGIFMGLIAVLELSHQLTKEELDYVKIMSDILSLHCEKDLKGTIESEYQHHHIVLDLLSNKIKDEKQLLNRMIERDWKVSCYYQVIIIDSKDYNDSYQDYLKNFINDTWKQCKSFIYEGYIFVLFELKEKNNSKILEWFEMRNFRIGISDYFEKLIDLNFYYYQAIKVLNHYNKKICIYDDYRFNDFVNEMHSHKHISSYLNQDVLKLIEYDQKYHSNLIDTLYEYYFANKSVLNTAKKMNIHKNTVHYRIEKIKEMFPNMFNDYLQELHVQLTLYIILDNKRKTLQI